MLSDTESENKLLTVLTKLNLSSLLVPLFIAIAFTLLGSWIFRGPFVLALGFSLAGCAFNLLINWSVRIPGGKDNINGDLLHPKYELMAYILLIGFITVVTQIFPNLKNYGFI